MPLHRLPPDARPRERLLSLGAEALSEAELLALVIRTGRTGESSLHLAMRLLADFGGLAGLATARSEELAQKPGVGAAKAASLVAAFRLGRLASSAALSRPVLRTAADAGAIAVRELGSLRRERVLVLVCDGANRLKTVVTVAEGSIDRAPFPVREILNAVIRHDGSAFIVAHNHPSGDATPSDEDRRTTEKLSAAAGEVGLRFLDHVVVSGARWRPVKASPRTRD
jgi:DNA repair protein RadC